MDKNIIDSPLIDPNLVSYEKFFDHKWCERTFEAVRNTALEEAVGDLMMAWRSTNGAHILPWLAVENLKGFAAGELEGSLSYRTDYSKEVITGIVGKIENLMQYSLDFDQRRALRKAVIKIEEDGHRAVKIAREQMKKEGKEKFEEGYWNFLVSEPEFQFCIIGIQRINYGSLFFTYEDFLANVIRTKEPSYSSKKDPIKDAFARHFGDSLRDYCWTDGELDLAKLVRNALAHNGGRFGKDLEKYGSRFDDVTATTKVLLRGDRFNLVDGKIRITPDNTTYLFGVLKERVSKIIDEWR